jgi:hypothetical protein
MNIQGSGAEILNAHGRTFWETPDKIYEDLTLGGVAIAEHYPLTNDEGEAIQDHLHYMREAYRACVERIGGSKEDRLAFGEYVRERLEEWASELSVDAVWAADSESDES